MKALIVHTSASVLIMTSLLSFVKPRSASAFAFRHAPSTCVTSSSRPITSSIANQLQQYNGRKVQSGLMSSVQIFGRPATRLLSTTDGVDATTTTNEADATDNLVGEQDDASSSQGDTETWQNHRSRWAKRKHKKKMKRIEEENGDAEAVERMENDGLSWEKFDFGFSPKMDKRFGEKDGNTSPSNETGIPDHVLNTISTDSVTYQSYLQSETNLDKETSNESLQKQAELLALSPEVIQKSIDVLKPYVQDRRLERIDEVLNQRTRHTRFLFENPSNPSNVWACLRTLDSFGIQYVDVIVNSDSYQGKAAVNQKRGMRTAMGSAMWMTIRQFGSLEEAVTHLKEEGCLIYASDLNPSAKDVRDLTWDVDIEDTGLGGEEATSVNADQIKDQRPICIVMGNEDRGISDKMRELADETFYLPMSGFAESFNLSVATAITLAYMSAVSGRGCDVAVDGNPSCIKGPLRPGDLDPHELQCLRLKGVLNSVAQRRTAKALLKKEGIVLPNSMYN